MSRYFLFLGAVFCGLAVVLGAFGAHALRDHFSEERFATIYQTATTYQFYHGLALLILGLCFLQKQLLISQKVQRLILIFFVLGVCIFSGTLYALAISERGWLGAITPLGGALLIVGWAMSAYVFWRFKSVPNK